ncbi:hypothetical protein [Streptomyces sp. NPDC059371]|uniref:hypothetical protein n=1 Tax=Streptomyces sp. NPDC059371 TaxID=3346812 RepID=UPI0036C1E6A7
MRNDKKTRSYLGIAAILTALGAWMAVVCYSIATEPEKGAGSIGELQSEAANAIHNRDAEAFQNLFDEDTVGNSYSSNYMKRLEGISTESARAASAIHLGDTYIVLRFDGKEGTFCTSWLVTAKGNRKFLDASPTGWNACS